MEKVSEAQTENLAGRLPYGTAPGIGERGAGRAAPRRRVPPTLPMNRTYPSTTDVGKISASANVVRRPDACLPDHKVAAPALRRLEAPIQTPGQPESSPS